MSHPWAARSLPLCPPTWLKLSSSQCMVPRLMSSRPPLLEGSRRAGLFPFMALLPSRPEPLPKSWCRAPPPLPRVGDASDGVPTHVVEHLTLGGAVLLGDGVGHRIGTHEQCVPVVRAEAGQRDQTDGEWGKLFSDAKPVRKELLGLPPQVPKAASCSVLPGVGQTPRARRQQSHDDINTSSSPSSAHSAPGTKCFAHIHSLGPYTTTRVRHH